MNDDALFLLIGGLWLWQRWSESSPAQALQRGGAQVYELLHPSERAHADHLPGHQMTRAAIAKVARDAGFSAAEVPTMVAIALAESGGVPNALTITSREHSVGLWQINTRAHPHWTAEELKNPAINAGAAYALSRTPIGLRHWSAYKTGRYRSFL